MANSTVGLSPRQRDCLRLVWERQATSKEIAAELGIGKGTVDVYIREAVATLGAADRRAAAAMLFGGGPRPPVESRGDTAGVADPRDEQASAPVSMHAVAASRPWSTRDRPRNTLTLAQTLLWIAAIAIGSLVALSLAASVGDGLPRVTMPAIHAVHRLTH